MDYLEDKEKYLNSLSVGELIEILNKLPKEKKVYVTWESTVNELTKEFVYEACTGSIYIDGDYGFYKKDFEIDRPDQTCHHCLNPDSIMTPETCCTGCSRLQNDTDSKKIE